MQVLNIFGDGQNCQNQTFKWLYQLYKSKYQKNFFGKMFTVMLFHMYQVFSSLLGHLHFSLHFFSTFMEQLFNNHPISLCCRGLASPPVPSGAAAQKGEMKGRKTYLNRLACAKCKQNLKFFNEGLLSYNCDSQCHQKVRSY